MDKEPKELKHLGVISSNQSLSSMKTNEKGDEYSVLHVYLHPYKLVRVHIHVY